MNLLPQTLRRLRHDAGFTATALATLGICIGANITIFSVVDAILVRPLPFPDAGQLVAVHNSYPQAGAPESGASAVNYYDRRAAIKAFASVSIQQDASVIVGGDERPARVSVARVSPEFFATLGVPLAMGRTFTDAEMLYGPDQVAVLTDGFWRTRFNADPDVVGKTFLNDGLPTTIVGVLPRGFRFLSSTAQFYRPAAHGPDDIRPNNRHSNNYVMVARLAPGITLADAQAQMDAFNRQQLRDDPYAELLQRANFHTYLAPLHDDVVHDIRPALLLLQAAVLALLLIGGINLVNLLLIRAHGRAKEFAVRQALGAGRRHLLTEVMFETILLAVGGGLLGLLLGSYGIDALSHLGTDLLPLGRYVTLNGRVAAVALFATVIVGVLLALPVAFFNLRNRLAPALSTESRGGTASRATQWVRHGFIVAQIAVAFLLLSSAGLLGVSLEKILSTPPGFQPDQVLTGTIALPWKTYPDGEKRQAFLEKLDAALRVQPGVTAVGFTSGLPFAGNQSDNAIAVEGVELGSGDSIRTHYVSFALGEYWKALGIPLLEGRLLEAADNHREQRVCVVDDMFARRYWPHESALGHRIASDATFTEDGATTIVGVVGHVAQKDLADRNALGAVYFPYRNFSAIGLAVVVRTPLEPAALAATLRETVLSIDPELPVDNIKPMAMLVDESLVSRRSPALLAGAFALTALLLAAIGTYGVLTYAVGQRRREIGVRMALGALPTDVLRQFLRLGAILFLGGLAIGLPLAGLAGYLMRSQLYGVSAFNLGVLLVTGAMMGLVVFVAILLPSQRAARVHPLEALRQD